MLSKGTGLCTIYLLIFLCIENIRNYRFLKIISLRITCYIIVLLA